MALCMRSEMNLRDVHPDLVRVVRQAESLGDVLFVVTEGRRTVERQKQLVASGASKTMNSRHITGHAVDLAVKVGDEIRWDWPLYKKLGELMKEAARIESVPIEWGGDWKDFKDGPHFQLTWKAYP